MSRLCPGCKGTIDPEQWLCPSCFFAEGLKSSEGEGAKCSSCRMSLDSDARFCSRCGAPVSQADAVASDPVRSALEEKLGDQYRIERLLGRGGMGSVYLARELTLDRDVAIKVMSAGGDARQLYERFRREARIAAKLSHPNIVPLHAFGEVQGMPYFVMGYVRGESLSERLRREGRLPEEDARRIFAEVADALDHAHQQGVIHRDVKPDNVLLEDQSGRALLTDFGVAKPLGQGETLTHHGIVIGTPDYMSPEQAGGRGDIDGRSDIYSLGVMAWAMVTGKLPFEGTTPADVLRKHMVEEPPALRSVAPHVSDATAQAIERCLAKEPAGRWPDARSLSLALASDLDSNLPDALRTAESSGLPALAITGMLSMFYAALMRANALEPGDVAPQTIQGDAIFVSGFIPVLALFAYLFFVTRLRREGFSYRELQRVIWREPSWWLWWYPSALRRPGNVWERLPLTVRSLRWSIAAFLVNLLVGWALFSFLGYGYLYSDLDRPFRVEPHSPAALIQFGIVITNVLAWIVFTIAARRELRLAGLFEEDVNRVMMSVPPSRAGFWARPHIAAILGPAPAPKVDWKIPESPHSQMQVILRAADELTGELRTLGAQAAVAARHLVASIETLDREIAEVERSVDTDEKTRLRKKIETLTAGQSDASAPLRSLLEKQLELIESLSGQIEEKKERRARRAEVLRSLASDLASLRGGAKSPPEVREIRDSIRRLCDGVQGSSDSVSSAVPVDTSALTIER